jgi:hypothetical protein
MKKGVDVANIQPQIVLALITANNLYRDEGVELVYTSGRDGEHSLTSLHYSGNAVDLRSRDLKAKNRLLPALIRDRLADRLGVDYDVVLEKNHIHLEYQPRRR